MNYKWMGFLTSYQGSRSRTTLASNLEKLNLDLHPQLDDQV
jgi:hypothetical protein